ncbi:MAG: N-acetylglucosamine kinase [Chitinophagaceae bacterium]|nr:MAG: N-acetylglucosamine kinase [Chitinophagaceae bacterium]
MGILIADSGATKCEWCYIDGRKKKHQLTTQGISPYFLNTAEIESLLRLELVPGLKKAVIDQVYYYGTGCKNPENVKSIKKAISKVFPEAKVDVATDLMAAARALCGDEKGIVSILGTGSNSCYFDGKKIKKNSPGLGYVLGDEGSGAYLGKKVLQYYLYNTFDEELRYKFDLKYNTNEVAILDQIYKHPLPNKYLAGFTLFLVENRGHYMIENIIEDGLNDFFFTHLFKYSESWKLPMYFVGSVAFGFQDVVRELCNGYEFEFGKILRAPMEGLIEYHSN